MKWEQIQDHSNLPYKIPLYSALYKPVQLVRGSPLNKDNLITSIKALCAKSPPLFSFWLFTNFKYVSYSKYIQNIFFVFCYDLVFLFCYDSTIICGHILRQDYDWIFHTKSLQTFQKRINQYQLLLCEVKQHRCLNSENHRIKTKLFINMVLRTDLQKHINL